MMAQTGIAMVDTTANATKIVFSATFLGTTCTWVVANADTGSEVLWILLEHSATRGSERRGSSRSEPTTLAPMIYIMSR